MEKSPHKIKSKDKGADTLDHYRYQHSYTCMLAIKLYARVMESGLIFNEIFCEQHEVILGITSDEKFVGIQIKSRILLG